MNYKLKKEAMKSKIHEFLKGTKQMSKKTVITLSAIALFSYCSQKPATFKDVDVNGKYSISIPDYLEKTNEMGSEPSLQYVNHKDEVYIMVVDKPTATLAAAGIDNIQKYYESVLAHITEGMQGTAVGMPRDTMINGKRAIFTQVSGQFNVNNELHDCFYEMEVIQDSVKSLQVITWTMDHHEDKFKGDMDKMLGSVKF